MSALQATVTKFFSLADGTLRLQVDIHHRDSHEALTLLCEVGAQVAVARLAEEQTEQQRYDSVTTTGAGRQVDEEPLTATDILNNPPDSAGIRKAQEAFTAPFVDKALEILEAAEGKQSGIFKDPLTGTIMAHFYKSGFFQSPKVLRVLAGKHANDVGFLLWLRTQVCWHCSKQDRGEDGQFYVQAAHVRRVNKGAGTSVKPQFSAIPLCKTCHDIQHAVGESGLAPQEWWDQQAAKAREEWGHMKLREVFATDSISVNVRVDELWVWLRTNDLLNYVPAKVRRSVEQRQREAASGSAGAVGADPVVEG